MTDLKLVLRDLREVLVDQALHQLHEARLFHYERDKEKTYDRLACLFDIMLQCVTEQRADPIVEHANLIAEERFFASYDLSEVQTFVKLASASLLL